MKTSDGRDLFVIPGGDGAVTKAVESRDWFWFSGASADAESLPVFLSAGRAPDGRLVCHGLIIGDLANTGVVPREVTARAMRKIRIPELLREISNGEWRSRNPGNAILASDLLDEAPALAPRVRQQEYDDQHFRDVADWYRRAVAEIPRSPTKWLAEQLHVSEPTARRWVQRARDRGHLGPSTPGRAGEQASRKEG